MKKLAKSKDSRSDANFSLSPDQAYAFDVYNILIIIAKSVIKSDKRNRYHIFLLKRDFDHQLGIKINSYQINLALIQKTLLHKSLCNAWVAHFGSFGCQTVRVVSFLDLANQIASGNGSLTISARIQKLLLTVLYHRTSLLKMASFKIKRARARNSNQYLKTRLTKVKGQYQSLLRSYFDQVRSLPDHISKSSTDGYVKFDQILSNNRNLKQQLKLIKSNQNLHKQAIYRQACRDTIQSIHQAGTSINGYLKKHKLM